MTSGRIVDLAIHPSDPETWYVAAASGGVWKTTNAGTTWRPIFDGEASYSIGCLAIDPEDPNVVWVGTGENNSQRSVGYGDGVYKSVDGGTSWTNVGLERSEHVGKIVIDPRDSDVVYVAAQGPLWSAGGDRGLYKTTDGGASWQKILEISENTGVSDLALDPRDPDVLYAAAYQRRRRVWTLLNGGPESGLFKSTDGGKTWRELTRGLPEVDIGRIGLAISPADPDVVYAIVEAALEEGGFFRSTDRGENWEKRSDYVSASPQYYQEIFTDPRDVDRVYSADVWFQVTEDGGKTFERVPETHKHVDTHALWIDPENTDRLLVGCDGGLYETYDRGETWRYFANLPLTQFYKLAVDDATPFYRVYGGTQDNFTLGGPSRTLSAHGITNADWFVTVGGDGFQPRIEPQNPDVVYSQSQYGGLVRHDRRTGEVLDIQPQPAPGEDALRWNWDAPLVLSPHSPTRLYFAAQRVFRSDDRGASWRAVSGDLTRGIDRNALAIMGRVWSVDAVSKNRATSPYGNVVSLDESPLEEGLLYAGTDDGLVQVTADGGETWQKIASFPGVPERTYVNDLLASRHRADRVYAVFNHHKSGDFAPYLLRSDDRGKTWASVAGDLPERGSVYAVAEDPVRPELLFAGTEFGVFFTLDGGDRWVELTGGMPTIAVRDLAIQERESDLVLGTFGRGFYVLDDYAPLRHASLERLENEAAILFPIRDALLFNPSFDLGVRGKSFQGDAFYAAPNPPYGAIVTYYLRDGRKTRAERRREAEKKLEEEGKDVAYPPWEDLRAETREAEPRAVLTVTAEDGSVVRRLEGPAEAGIHRLAWDLRLPPPDPASLEPPPDNPFRNPPRGPMVPPGTYEVSLALHAGGETVALGEPQTVRAVPLGLAILPPEDREALFVFQRETAELQRAVSGALRAADEAEERIAHLRVAIRDTPSAPATLDERLDAVEDRLRDLLIELRGDPVLRAAQEPQPPSIADRVDQLLENWAATAAPTGTHRRSYQAAAAAFARVLAGLREVIGEDLRAIEADVEKAGGPWTPGRLPEWEQ